VTSPALRGLPLTFYSVAEPEPGPGWQGLFSSAWPAYRRWYLRDGAAARSGLRECQRMLATHMPELVPTWRRLVELAGGDPLAAQMLTLYNPPPASSTSRRQVGTSSGMCVASIRWHSRRPLRAAAPSRRYQRR